MAVYTQIDKTLLVEFLTKYDIGRLQHYRGISEGVENTNYYLETEQNAFILTLYEKRVDEKDLPFFINLMQHLANYLNVPKPIQQKAGGYLDRLKHRPCVITSFLEGKALIKAESQACMQVGKALAKLHKATKNFSQTRPNRLSMQSWRPLWLAAKNKAQGETLNMPSNFAEPIEKELYFLEHNWPKNLPEGIIHADLFMDNVFFKDGQFSAIIDFYFSCKDSLAYDLAITLNAWAFDPSFCYDPTKGKALLQAYHKERALTKEEQASFLILLRGAAMRFFLTRFYDWFFTQEDSIVNKKSPLEYWQKLQFFQNITAIQQLGF